MCVSACTNLYGCTIYLPQVLLLCVCMHACIYMYLYCVCVDTYLSNKLWVLPVSDVILADVTMQPVAKI